MIFSRRMDYLQVALIGLGTDRIEQRVLVSTYPIPTNLQYDNKVEEEQIWR